MYYLKKTPIMPPALVFLSTRLDYVEKRRKLGVDAQVRGKESRNTTLECVKISQGRGQQEHRSAL